MNAQGVTLLPASVRRVIYIVVTLVSLGFSAAAAFYAVSPYVAPWWIASALAAIGVVGAPFGVLAAVNTRDPQPVVEPVESDLGWMPGDDSESDINDVVRRVDSPEFVLSPEQEKKINRLIEGGV